MKKKENQKTKYSKIRVVRNITIYLKIKIKKVVYKNILLNKRTFEKFSSLMRKKKCKKQVGIKYKATQSYSIRIYINI